MLAIGLMSGTSLDGVDAVLVEILERNDSKPIFKKIFFKTVLYSEQLKTRILEASRITTSNVQKICSLNFELGYVYADAIEEMLQDTKYTIDQIDFIAMHGQTIWHNPNDMDGYFSSTMQIGEPSVISYRFNKTVISNFRVMDIAAGGSGAPLIPFVNYLMYQDQTKNIAMQNIGGIGNVAYLPKNGDINDVIAFDTGPGNMLIDEAMQWLFNLPYDEGGQTAMRGTVNQNILKELINDEYLKRPLPKSTGREKYNKQFLQTIIDKMKNEPAENVIATLTAYTAHSIIKSYHDLLPSIDKVIVSGGGSHNEYIMKLLKENLSCEVMTHEDTDSYEAFGFVVLGYYTIKRWPSNIPAVTGASQPVVLGNFTYPPKG